MEQHPFLQFLTIISIVLGPALVSDIAEYFRRNHRNVVLPIIIGVILIACIQLVPIFI